MKQKVTASFTPPFHKSQAFNCPHCGAYAHQFWEQMYVNSGPSGMTEISGLQTSCCAQCGEFAVWLEGQMLYPDFGTAPPPNPDLSTDVRTDYEEARSILARSPRGAAALLRLAIQKLCAELGEPGKNLNTDIGTLVSKGLPFQVQQALDAVRVAVRVIGNEAVHPGQIDVTDSPEMAGTLFALVNFITDKMISEPKAIEQIYGSLPPDKHVQIQKRDNG